MLVTLGEKRVQRYIRAVKRQTRASRQPRVNFPRKISTENIRNDRCHANSRQKKLSKFVKGNKTKEKEKSRLFEQEAH